MTIKRVMKVVREFIVSRKYFPSVTGKPNMKFFDSAYVLRYICAYYWALTGVQYLKLMTFPQFAMALS